MDISALLRGAIRPESTAAGIAMACRTLAAENPKLAITVLANSWQIIAEVVAAHCKDTVFADRELTVSALFIEQYFHQHGDWKAMAAKLLEGHPECGAYAEHVCARMLQKVREEA